MKRLLILGSLMLLALALAACTSPDPPGPYVPNTTDAQKACVEVLRSKLTAQGTPEGDISVDWGKTDAYAASDQPGQWNCHVTATAPNVFGAKRVSTYLVEIKDLDHSAGRLTWTNLGVYP